MNKPSYVLFVLSICVHQIIVVGKATADCSYDTTPFKDSCYYLSYARATRIEAAATCRPGHLVDITSVEEQDFVVNLLTRAQIDDAWFGLLKSLSWSDGSPLVYEYWQDIVAEGEHHCFRLDQSKGYSWNDKSCDQVYRYICEYEGSAKCKKNYMSFQNSCYQVHQNKLSRPEAVRQCWPAHLADITSAEEQAFVAGILSASHGGNGDAWFGLTLSNQPTLSDGSVLTPGSWFDIRMNSNGICFQLENLGANMYRWDDTSCDERLRYVCEYNVNTNINTSFSSSGSDSTDSQLDIAGIIVGSLIGVAVLVTVIFAVFWFVLRLHTTRNAEEFQSPETNISSTNNGTNQYHTVRQAAEYTYIESHLEPPQINGDIPAFTEEQETPPLPYRESTEGWRDNTIYVTSDGTSAQIAGEGWTDNLIYAE